MKKEPTGEEMIQRSRKIKEMVREVLKEVPATRGDHMLLYVTVLKRYYRHLVKVTMRPTLKIEYKTFNAFFLCPAAETVRRRCQEIQSEEREKIWRKVAEMFPQWADNEDFRRKPECIAMFCKLAAGSEFLPTERTLRKRIRNETAHEHEFGIGQLSLDDFLLWDESKR